MRRHAKVEVAALLWKAAKFAGFDVDQSRMLRKLRAKPGPVLKCIEARDNTDAVERQQRHHRGCRERARFEPT